MKADAQPLVSVLTPVYNGEKYLPECIESVLAQTYQNWEYCIVNNCSTDRTLEIAQTYAERDRRIRIHNNTEFVGCDQNGNIAFQHISLNSQYCKVVHADDWLFPECVMKMVELAEAHPTVAIVDDAYGLRNDRVSWDGLPYPSTVIPGRQICRNTFLGGPYVFGSPTSLLIRSDEVRKRPTFYNEEGVRHFDSIEHDPAWRGRVRPPGRYRSTAWIPGNYLAEGTVFIDVGLDDVEPEIEQFFERQAVAFHVIDSTDGDSARGDYGGPFPGVVRSLLKWNTVLSHEGFQSDRCI